MAVTRARLLPAWLLAGMLQLGALTAQEADGWQQQPSGHLVRAVPLAGCAALALAVVWPHGMRPDAGEAQALAQLLARCRGGAAAAALPAGARVGLEVGNDATLFQALLPQADGQAAARWLEALAADVDSAQQADQLALQAARAALAADDAEWLYPGDVLAGRARKALASGSIGGASLRGSPQFLQRCTPAGIAAELRRPVAGPLRLLAVGDVAGLAPLTAALAAIPWQQAGAAACEPAAPEEPCSRHPRVDGPFVAAAIAAPVPGSDSLWFAVAAEVLRSRANQSFGRYRGGELLANTPFVSYAFLRGDPVLVLHRRGPDGGQPATPRAELEALLLDVRTRTVSARELQTAVALLLAELAVPPWTSLQIAAWRANPEGLVLRARSLALLGHWRIADGDVRALATAAEAVPAGLAAALAAPRIWWGGLEPSVSLLPLSGN